MFLLLATTGASSCRSPFTTHRWCLLFCLVVVSVVIIIPVHGWGKEGHEIVANLAYARLSHETQTVVKNILRQSDGSYGEDDKAGSPLASVANWADHLRANNAFHWSAPLHYIDIQDQAIEGGCPCTNDTLTVANPCQFVYDRDCVDNICVAGAIMNFTLQLSNWSSSTSSSPQTDLGMANYVRSVLRGSSNDNDNPIREALMFLVHFVGDIHQPLHSARASDKGGNAFHVHFPKSPSSLESSLLSRLLDLTHHRHHPHPHPHPNPHPHPHDSVNLHSVWDSAIIERAIQDVFSGSREAMEGHLTVLIQNATDATKHWLECANGWNQVCVTEWAEESFQDALEWAYRNVDGTEVMDGSVLDDMYYQTRLLVVQRRLAAGGVRLAATLESLLGPNKTTTTTTSLEMA